MTWQDTLSAVALAATVACGPAHADSDQPVVVELFTSQGCSSCPPADALLGELAKRDDVIALGLHVDYWDYLGWADPMADPAYTARQRRYAAAAGSRTVFTPQMIVEGVDHVVGTKPGMIARLIDKHGARPDAVDLELTRENQLIEVRAEGRGETAVPATVYLVHVTPEVRAGIDRGENAGRVVVYHNVVTGLEKLADWDGREPIRLEAKADGPAAVIVQKADMGAILAAGWAR